MLINLIGCGDSASKWDGSGDSIGVNDAFKFGHKIQRLVLLNNPTEFESDRLKIIKATNPEIIYTCYRDWQKPQYGFNNVVFFNYSVWQGQLKQKAFQTSHTSPFCAISIAWQLGYDEIVLWGVDFKTHPIWNQNHHAFYQEIKNYQQICEQLKNRGIMVYSATATILKLPVSNSLTHFELQ